MLIPGQGQEFVNEVKDELLHLTGTEHQIASTYSPQILIERFNQTLQVSLLKLVKNSPNDWDQHLPAVLFAYHANVQATNHEPFEMMSVLPVRKRE